MAIYSKLPDLGKAFEAFKPAILGANSGGGNTLADGGKGRNGAIKCLSCKSRYRHDELIKIYERGNQECYPFLGCPACGTDDHLTGCE